jgi:cell division protein FtsQ
VKRPEREILGQEKIRLKRSSKKAPKSKVGPFTLWGRFLAIFGPVTLGAVILASFFTPMFAIEKIEVSGTERLEQKELEKSLEFLMERPLTLVGEAELADTLGKFALIETFTFQAEPPHTLKIKIRERQPVVVLVRGGKNYLYDPAGIQIAEAEDTKTYPFLVLIGEPKDNPRFEAAIELLLSLPRETYAQIFSIEVTPQLTSRLVLRKGNTVVLWGDANDSLLKAKVLDSLIATGVEDGVLIDVSSPNAPVVTYPDF